ncbi:hypothetical protein IFR05_015251 [Cadophora sp. M221]|nr:hypothetical protein IFR05_015251 [Cadophora sp. M221]
MPISAARRFIDTVPASLLAQAHLNLRFTVWDGIYGSPRLLATEDRVKRKLRRARELEWEGFWRAFARVQARRMVVEIYDGDSRLSEQALLEPLRQVSAKGMEALLPWPKESEMKSDNFEDAEFVVRRPPEGMDLAKVFNVAKDSL